MYMHRLQFWPKVSQVPNVNSVHIAVTQRCYEGCRDLKYQMNWCDLLFALISLGVLWWKVAVLVLFSSFFFPINHDLTRFFLLDSCCISSGPQGSIQWSMAAWLYAIQMISLSTDPLLWQQMSPRWLILFFPSTANQSFPLYADKWTGNRNLSLVLLW